MCMQSHGIAVDKIAEVAKCPIPLNLYNEIHIRQERTAKAAETVLYSTTHLPETNMIFYDDHDMMTFDATIVDVFKNVQDGQKPNILILDRSAIYPTSGGQEHDTGSLTIAGCAGSYKIVNAVKVGKVVLHTLDRPLEGYLDLYKGKNVTVEISEQRRKQLQAHHTGTHIVFAACRQVLGPHVWQNGARKTEQQAHLDITHYQSLTKEQELAIENTANRIINSCAPITKSFMDKAEAELEYGFHLYQGGVVPGNQLRVVNIKGVDTEACCGTHCDSTAEVGWIKLIKTQRISDGIVRLYYCAAEKAIAIMNEEQGILNNLTASWGIPNSDIVDTAMRFFNESKRLQKLTEKQEKQILNLQMKSVLSPGEDKKMHYIASDAAVPTFYFSFVPQFAHTLKEQGKGVVFFGDSFVFGLIGHNKCDDLLNEITEKCKEMSKTKEVKINKKDKVKFDFKIKGQKPIETKDICQFNITGGDFKPETIVEILTKHEFVELA